MKLKARLLKPSIILPLGKYIVGAHHLNLLYETFNKDQHGLRLDHKDRQNYNAVERITSLSNLQLLNQIPDALGTKYYLTVL